MGVSFTRFCSSKWQRLIQHFNRVSYIDKVWMVELIKTKTFLSWHIHASYILGMRLLDS